MPRLLTGIVLILAAIAVATAEEVEPEDSWTEFVDHGSLEVAHASAKEALQDPYRSGTASPPPTPPNPGKTRRRRWWWIQEQSKFSAKRPSKDLKAVTVSDHEAKALIAEAASKGEHDAKFTDTSEEDLSQEGYELWDKVKSWFGKKKEEAVASAESQGDLNSMLMGNTPPPTEAPTKVTPLDSPEKCIFNTAPDSPSLCSRHLLRLQLHSLP